MCAKAGDRRSDAAGEAKVVVLDEERLAEAHPVVRAAAAPDRVLLELAQTGSGLASVEQRGARPFEFGDASGGQRCDAAEAAEDVQRRPLARENGSGGTCDAGNLGGNMVHSLAVLDLGRDRDRGIERGEHGPDDRQAADHSGFLDQKRGAGDGLGLEQAF